MQSLALGIGGAIGASLRYLVGLTTATLFYTEFPIATLLINLIGCFILGYLSSTIDFHWKLNPTLKIAFKSGLIGSFTTFSTFSVETVRLLQAGTFIYALLYIMLSAGLGFGLAWSGMIIGENFTKKLSSHEKRENEL